MVTPRDSIGVAEVAMAALTRPELLAGSDAPAPRLDDRTTPRDHLDARQAQMRALGELYLCERTQHMATHPELLAAMRARQVTLNSYLEERGLPPQPDPYHELP